MKLKLLLPTLVQHTLGLKHLEEEMLLSFAHSILNSQQTEDVVYKESGRRLTEKVVELLMSFSTDSIVPSTM